jgi:molecular chaperone HtpG
MLKGVLDCPELPLNVSRSYLQTNTYVSKLSAHIVKKLADKLCSLCNNEREEYERIWNDIAPYIEYACMRDKKFYDRVKSALLLKLTDGSFVAYEDYLADAKEKHENRIYYATDKDLQAQYIAMLGKQDVKVALFERSIETQFASMLEQYMEGVSFTRVDANIADSLKSDEAVAESEALKGVYAEILGEGVKIEFSSLKDEDVPAILTVSEEARRREDMMRLYGMSVDGSLKDATFTVNTASPLTAKLEELSVSDPEKAKQMASYVYKLSLLSQKKFSAEEMQEFMREGFELMMKL